MYIPPLKTKDLTPETLAYIKRLAKTCYPSYAGRKFGLSFAKSYRMQNYWDGGTRYYAIAVNLATGATSAAGWDTTNPWKQSAHAEFPIPEGFAILEHVYFCGKDMGIRLVVSPIEKTVPGLIPPLQSLPA